MNRNLILIRLIYGLRYCMFFLPIIVIFMQAYHLSFTDFFITQAVFALVYAICNLPGGYLSDRIGWKNSLIIASVLNIIASGFFVFWHSFTSFIIAESLLGLAFVLFNGSEIALLYESLVASGRGDEYKQQQGVCELWGRIAEGLACVAGGVLANYSLNLPFQVEFCFSFLLLPCVLLLTNVKPSSPQNLQLSLIATLKTLFILNVSLRWVVFYSSIIGFITLTAVWLMQPYFADLHISLIWFGIGWALINVVTGLGATWQPKLAQQWGDKVLLLAIPLLLTVCLTLFSLLQSIFLYLVMLVIALLRGIKIPLVMNLINHRAASNMRATAINSESLLTRLLFAIMAPWIGYLADAQHGLSRAFFILMGIVAVITLLTLWRVTQRKDFEHTNA